MPHSKKKSFIRSSPLAYVVVPLALAAVTAALLAALSFVLLQPYQMMLGWFFDNTTASQPQTAVRQGKPLPSRRRFPSAALPTPRWVTAMLILRFPAPT